VFELASWRAKHWFDALGMIYVFRINGPASVTFRSRMLDCEAARDAAAGKHRLATFGSPLVRTFLQRALEPVPRNSDNTNVNIVQLGEDLVAMTETDRQVVIDPSTLSARGNVSYTDTLNGALMIAHPHMDFARGRVVNIATSFGRKATLTVYEHAPPSRERKAIGWWRTKRLPYVHSFGLTPRNAILIAHPFSAKPLDFLWSDKAFVDHFSWRPKDGTRLIVMDRHTGACREHVVDPFFVFHTVNAFERGDETVLDVLAYPDADIVSQARVARIATRAPDLPVCVRIVMRAGVERARAVTVGDARFEFPSTNYRRVNGNPYQFAWGAGPGRSGSLLSEIVKVDMITGSVKSFVDEDHIFGEPVFVARPGASDEDDGVLVTVGSSKTHEASVLMALDARSLDPVASAEVPANIPLGFHGSFLRAPAESPS
jgi:carotenoid cleavage dioxygenase-like enzyme